MAIMSTLLSYCKSGTYSHKDHRLLIHDQAQASDEEPKSSTIAIAISQKSIRDEFGMDFARKRILNELRKMGDDQVSHCSYGVVNDITKDPFNLQGIIIGPSATPFEGGIFFLAIHVPTDYPFKPPRVKFLTKVFHPNVTSDGTIQIDILSTNWTPALTIQKLLLSICSFLPDPNHEKDACNPVCDLYWNHRNRYHNIAREWTRKYAML